MAKLLKLRRGTTSQHNTFTGAEGEVTIDTTKDTAVVHDGSTAGGRPLAREDMSNVSSSSIASRLGADSIATTKIAGGALPTDVTVASANIVNGTIATDDIGGGQITSAKIADGTIVNADINASAGIAGTKISPDFGSQNIQTTGQVQINGSYPVLRLYDSDNENDYSVRNNNGQFIIHDDDAGSTRLAINANGTTSVAGNLDANGGLDVSGTTNLTNTSTTNAVKITGTGSHELYSYHDTGGCGWSTGSGGSFGELLYLDEANSRVRFYTGGLLRGYYDSNGLNINGSLIGDRADFRDDGTASPTVKIAADDQSPWALQIRNDSYWNDDSNGLKIYQDNSGNIDSRVTGNGAFINWYFNTQNGGVTNTAIHIDTNRAVNLRYQGNQKLTTTSSGISVTGNVAVSGTVDGRDVASDGSKLDGIESGATADQTASEILTLIKTVDGSGSGLDADTLDGHSSAAFIRANAADTADGDITFNGGSGAVTIAGNSDIRLNNGTWSGESTKIQHHSNWMYIQGGSNGHILRNTAGQNNLTLDNSGNGTFRANVTAYSDARLKTDIHTINDALGICGKLRGVSYKWIADGKPSIGVIAQEIEKVIPEVVLTNQDVNPVTQEITEIKSVDYGKIVGVLINAINELKAEVDELKGGK